MIPKTIIYWVVNRTSLRNLYFIFSLIDTIETMSKTDINDALLTLHSKILDFSNVICPILTKLITFKYQTKPWINDIIKHDTLERQNNYRLNRRKLSSVREFEFFRNLVRNQNSAAKRQPYEKLFWDNKQKFRKSSVTNQKRFAWAHLIWWIRDKK